MIVSGIYCDDSVWIIPNSIGSLFGPQIAANFVNSEAGPLAYNNVYLIAIGVAIIGLILNTYLIKKTA